MDTLTENLKRMLVLEAIRKSGNRVPYPLSEDWDALGDYINLLSNEGLLSIDSGFYCINTDGKKALLLYDTSRKDIVKAMDVFNNLLIGENKVDCRIAVESFKHRKSSDVERVSEHLFSIAGLIIWDDFFEMIKKLAKRKNTQWQKSLFDAFYFNAKKRARLDAWRQLGRTENEALITGTKLTNPNISKDLVHITRN